VVTVTANNSTLESTWNTTIGEFYVLTVSNLESNNSVTLMPYNPDYRCSFDNNKDNVFIGLPAVRLSPLTLSCTIPIFPPTIPLQVGGLANFSSITVSFPNKKNYYRPKETSFVVQPFWLSAGANLNGTVKSGDIIEVSGGFNANVSYVCSLSSSNVVLFGTTVSIATDKISCLVPEAGFADKAPLMLEVLEKVDSGYRTVILAESNPLFYYDTADLPPPVTTNALLIMAGGVGVGVGIVVGLLIGCGIAVLVMKVRNHRHHYTTI